MPRRNFYAGIMLVAGTCLAGVAHASSLTTLASITGSGDASVPRAALVDVGGVLYGAAPSGGAAGCGAIYSFDPGDKTETVVYSFKGGADGCTAVGALVSLDGALYGVTSDGGAHGNGTVFQLDLASGVETVLYAFKGGTDGLNPSAGMVAVNGTLYGVTGEGGTNQLGALFAVDIKTHSEKLLHSFAGRTDGDTPVGVLVNLNGVLYGVTSSGGAASFGTVYSFDLKAGTEKIVHSFTGMADGGFPNAGLVQVGTTLYGTTTSGGSAGSGVIYSIDSVTGVANGLFSFTETAQGLYPESPLVNVGEILYGTTVNGGTEGGSEGLGVLFSFDPTTKTETVLHSFGAAGDAANPFDAPVAVGNYLYGVAPNGGSLSAGALYKVDRTTGRETVAYSLTGATGFQSGEGLVTVGSAIYVATAQGGAESSGNVLSVSLPGNEVTSLYSFDVADGAYPSAALVNDNGVLYGTTAHGGKDGYGEVFKINPSTGTKAVIHSFTGGADGGLPYGNLILYNGSLYGTTVTGGASQAGGYGTVFKMNPATGAEIVLHAFTSTEGYEPFSGLTVIGGTLYGSTTRGGAGYSGTIFSVDPTTKTEKVIYNFTGGADGAVPSSLVNAAGLLYGMALAGGASSQGVVFSIDPATGIEKVLHAFTGGADGAQPEAGLLSYGGLLYGATSGGYGGKGTLFSIVPSSGKETVLHSFTGGANGNSPNTTLVEVGGVLYGATGMGGAANLGTIFAFKP